MASYTDACASTTAADAIITTGGINQKGVTGAVEGVVFTTSDFSFTNITAAKTKSNWDAGVALGKVFYIGKGKFENQGEDAEYFEDSDYDVRILQSKGTKVLQFSQVICACAHAKLLELNGKTGKFFFFTKLDFALGRLNEDLTVEGLSGQVQFEKRNLPTSDNPVAETIMTITFSDWEADERNPFEGAMAFEASSIDQIYNIDNLQGATTSDGSTLTTTLTLTEDCNESVMTGLLAADFSAEDTSGNALTIAGVTEAGATGVYTFQITTALTSAVIRTNNAGNSTEIIEQTDTLYYMKPQTVTVD